MTSDGGQFEVGALIGEGSFGKVFECFDKKDGKKKVCHQSQSFVKLFKSYELLSLVSEIIYINYYISIFHTNLITCIRYKEFFIIMYKT